MSCSTNGRNVGITFGKIRIQFNQSRCMIAIWVRKTTENNGVFRFFGNLQISGGEAGVWLDYARGSQAAAHSHERIGGGHGDRRNPLAPDVREI